MLNDGRVRYVFSPVYQAALVIDNGDIRYIICNGDDEAQVTEDEFFKVMTERGACTFDDPDINTTKFDAAVEESKEDYCARLDICGETITFEGGHVTEVASPRYGAYFKISHGRKVFYYRGNRVSKQDFFAHIGTEDKAADERKAIAEFVTRYGGSEILPAVEMYGNFVAQIHVTLANGRQDNYAATFDTKAAAHAFIEDFKALAGDMKFLATIKHGNFYGEEIYRHGLNGQEYFTPDTEPEKSDFDIANELTERLIEVTCGADFMDMTLQNGEKAVSYPSTAMVEPDRQGNGRFVFITLHGKVYARYDTAEQVNSVINRIKAAIDGKVDNFTYPTVDELKSKPAYDEKRWAIDFDICHGDSDLTEEELRNYADRLNDAMTANGNRAHVELEDCVITVYGDNGGDNLTVDKIIAEMYKRGCRFNPAEDDNEKSRLG